MAYAYENNEVFDPNTGEEVAKDPVTGLPLIDPATGQTSAPTVGWENSATGQLDASLPANVASQFYNGPVQYSGKQALGQDAQGNWVPLYGVGGAQIPGNNPTTLDSSQYGGMGGFVLGSQLNDSNFGAPGSNGVLPVGQHLPEQDDSGQVLGMLALMAASFGTAGALFASGGLLDAGAALSTAGVDAGAASAAGAADAAAGAAGLAGGDATAAALSTGAIDAGAAGAAGAADLAAGAPGLGVGAAAPTLASSIPVAGGALPAAAGGAASGATGLGAAAATTPALSGGALSDSILAESGGTLGGGTGALVGSNTPTLAGGLSGLGGGNLGTSLVGGAANVLGAGITAAGANKAADTLSQAANNANTQQNDILQQQLTLEKPFIDAGTAALPALTAGAAPGGQFNKPYTLQDFESGPQAGLYDFANQQAQTQLKNNLTTSGGVNTTDAGTEAATLASGLAGQFYNTGFNENQATNQMALGTLQGLAGEGQAGVAQSSGNLSNYGTSSANLTNTAANANASSDVANANAYGSVVSGLGKDLLTMNTLSSLFS